MSRIKFSILHDGELAESYTILQRNDKYTVFKNKDKLLDTILRLFSHNFLRTEKCENIDEAEDYLFNLLKHNINEKNTFGYRYNLYIGNVIMDQRAHFSNPVLMHVFPDEHHLRLFIHNMLSRM